MKATTFTVTPEWAKGILASSNKRNRKPKVSIVSKYTKDMLNGEWGSNGDSIRFGKSGALLDGQHRLMACVKSGVSFDAIVVTDVDDISGDPFVHIDGGKGRTRGDVLEAAGVADAHANFIADAAAYLLHFRDDPDFNLDHVKFSKELSRDQIKQEAENNAAALNEAARVVRKTKKGQSFARPNGLFMALWVKFGEVDPVLRDRYFDELINGAQRGSAVHLLRDHIQLSRVSNNEDRRKLISMAVKAFSALRVGKTYTVLRPDSNIPRIK